MTKYGQQAAAIVTFSFDNSDGDEQEVKFVVPAEDCWSAEGLASMFNRTRDSWLIKPDHERFDEVAWSSWHLKHLEEDTGLNLIIVKEDAIK